LEKKNEKVQQTKFAITMHGKSYLLFNGGNNFFCENIQWLEISNFLNLNFMHANTCKFIL
jgi:hypothetical protein